MAITTATQAAQIVNESLNTLGYQYQIDTTDGNTIETGFKAVGAFNANQRNSILQQINAILIFRNYGTMFNESKNPTRVFWRDFINYGGGLEDIYHELLEGNEGVWAGTDASEVMENLVAFHDGNVQKKFHTQLNKFQIPISVSDLEVSKAFTTEGMVRYIDVRLANLQWSAEVRLQNAVVSNIRSMVNARKIVFSSGHDINSTNGTTEMVETIRTITDGMKNISSQYNIAGITTMSDDSDLFLVVTPSFINRIRVRGYANAFNLSEYELKNRLITLPEGTDLGTDVNGKPVYCALVDRRAIVMALRYWDMKAFPVPNADYTNYFLKCEYLEGYNEFFNAVAVSGEDLGFFVESGDYVAAKVYMFSNSAESVNQGLTFKVNGRDYKDFVLEADGTYNIISMQIPKNSFVEISSDSPLTGFFVNLFPTNTAPANDTYYSVAFYAQGDFIVNLH